MGEIHQRRGIDVDVEEAGPDLLRDELPDLADFPLGIGGVFLGIDLAVVALNEHGEGVPFPQCRGENHRDVFSRTLLGIGDFGARDLENQRPYLSSPGRPEHRPRRIVGEHPHVDSRNRKAATFSPAAGQVELVYRGRTHPRGLRELPQPLLRAPACVSL